MDIHHLEEATMMPMMPPGGPGMGGMGGATGGIGMMPPMPTAGAGVDPAMLSQMGGPQVMSGQPMDPMVLQAILEMLGPGGGQGPMNGPMGPGGMPPSPAPPGQGDAMTPWQTALMGPGGMGGGGAAGIRGLPQGGGY